MLDVDGSGDERDDDINPISGNPILNLDIEGNPLTDPSEEPELEGVGIVASEGLF